MQLYFLSSQTVAAPHPLLLVKANSRQVFLLLLSDGGRVGHGGREREAETSDNDNDQQHLVRGHNRGIGHCMENSFMARL